MLLFPSLLRVINNNIKVCSIFSMLYFIPVDSLSFGVYHVTSLRSRVSHSSLNLSTWFWECNIHLHRELISYTLSVYDKRFFIHICIRLKIINIDARKAGICYAPSFQS